MNIFTIAGGARASRNRPASLGASLAYGLLYFVGWTVAIFGLAYALGHLSY